MAKNPATLEGVSETTMWTLHNRATEAKLPNGSIRDPLAVSLFDRIDFDYLKFGRPNQSHALRALAFDGVMSRYLQAHPSASVVALAEGLQTSFWRLEASGVAHDVTWYSVDLPPVMALRRQLLPSNDRIVELAQSALDYSWMDAVDGSKGTFITAEGLLMYLDPADAIALIAAIAARFPGGQLMFDSIPPWLSKRTLTGWRLSDRYTAPPMPFGLNADQALALAGTIPGVSSAEDVRLPAGRGLFRLLNSPLPDHLGIWRRARPSITVLNLG